MPRPGRVSCLGCVHIALHFLEFIIQPPARYSDLFPVLNVLISTPGFGLVWLWSIKSGIEVRCAVVGLGGSNPVAHSSPSSQSIQHSSNTNLTSVTSPKVSYFHSTHRGDPGSSFSVTDSPLSHSDAFNRRMGSPPVEGRPRFKDSS